VIEEAVKILQSGGVVAFPTETVYGLGADARNLDAVQRVFHVKGRPPTNPVIVHVADEDVAKRYAASWPHAATSLVERFWPGPLTIVLPKTDAIVPAVTAGRNTVGLRAPDHSLTLELLRRFDGPLIGPSANRSTRVSPTTAQHVHDELGNAIDLILDGGPCRVGIESTVLDLSGERPTILRPGAVSMEQVAEVIGPIDLFRGSVERGTAAPSPGMHPVHYAPITPTYRFEAGEIERVAQWCAGNRARVSVLLRLERPDDDEAAKRSFGSDCKQMTMPADADAYARQMYAALRHADRLSPAAIWIEMPPDEPRWLAVRDRLTRASRAAP
jgi:L-threonylcarbamoyladenylate synthase